ncbi:hypothetical protein BX666DRAFT_1957204 [Dichotomocladium elegans]|nr:hypothetical protein BX666DRAFT_1957204 [Dichotomocladium elegans]
MISSLQRHNIVLVVVLLVLVFSLSYLRHATNQIERPLPGELTYSPSPSPAPPPPPLPPILTSRLPGDVPDDRSPCDKVEFGWLASDRKYWDGWASKAMFMSPDGNFTTMNLSIVAGETLCAVVQLGPIPAVAAIRPEIHFAPADSITIQAVGGSVKIPINLQQHPKQSNIYFSPVRFTHPDTYRLESTTEYRSYFWESPLSHPHRPFHYSSHNTLTVTHESSSEKQRPALGFCDDDSAVTGSWVNQTEFRRAFPRAAYDRFEDTQSDYSVDQRVYVPDTCRLRSLSPVQVTECLDLKTIHVWGDDQIKRNIKAFVSNDQWCRTTNDDDNGCGCNDDWDLSPTGNVTMMYSALDSIYNTNWRDDMQTRTAEMPEADVVILGVGNQEVGINRLSSSQFWNVLMEFLYEVTTHIYPTQKIILRTPQYFCCGTIHNSAWNQGRSRAFANVFRHAVQQLDSDRIILWDTHKIGVDDNVCPGSINSKRNLINIENNLLWNFLCPAPL